MSAHSGWLLWEKIEQKVVYVSFRPTEQRRDQTKRESKAFLTLRSLKVNARLNGT